VEKDSLKQPIVQTTNTIQLRDRLSVKTVLLDSNALTQMELSIQSSVREGTIAQNTMVLIKKSPVLLEHTETAVI